jgi:sec-independent protein translocase protein TatA
MDHRGAHLHRREQRVVIRRRAGDVERTTRNARLRAGSQRSFQEELTDMGLDNPIHIAFLLILLLLVFGAKRLPEMGRSLGDGMRGFKDALGGHAAVSATETTPQSSVPRALAAPSQSAPSVAGLAPSQSAPPVAGVQTAAPQPLQERLPAA